MFFKSNNVKIFPCFHRGQYIENNKTLYYNPESRLATEYNFTHIPGLLLGYDSFVIEHTDACVRCVIHGYYFEFTGDAAGKLQDSEGNLKGKLIIREGKLASQSENGSNYLLTMAAGDQPSLDTVADDKSYCTAVWYDFETSNDPNMPAKFTGTEGTHTLDLEDEYRRIIIKNNVHSLKVIEDHVGDSDNPHGVTAKQLGVAAFKNKTLATSVTQGDANAVTGGAVHAAIETAKSSLKGNASDAATDETIAGAKKYAEEQASNAVEKLVAEGQVNTNKEAIEGLQKALGTDTTLGPEDTSIKSRVDKLEKEFDDPTGRVKVAEDKIDVLIGDTGTIAAGDAATLDLATSYTDDRETITRSELKTAYEAYADQAETDAVATAKSYTDAEIDKLEAKDTEIAGNVTALQGIVENGDNSNANLRQAITELQTLTGEDGAIERAIEAVNEDLQTNYLSKTDVEGTELGIYAVAFDLSKYSGNPEDLSSDFKAATSRPIVFISGCSMIPSPPDGYAWFDSSDEDALEVEVEAINTNIILYLKESNTP